MLIGKLLSNFNFLSLSHVNKITLSSMSSTIYSRIQESGVRSQES
ncbi:hypothetical protein [Trichormus sp. NMC-1]|nr:hypothetical protein [Trichormus sp. NMC-1]